MALKTFKKVRIEVNFPPLLIKFIHAYIDLKSRYNSPYGSCLLILQDTFYKLKCYDERIIATIRLFKSIIETIAIRRGTYRTHDNLS